MKIAIWHNNHSGGARRALYYHVKGLAERGHELVVWSPSVIHTNYLPLSDYADERYIPLHIFRNDNVLCKDFLKSIYFYPNINGLKKHCKKCAEEINRLSFDVFLDYGCEYSTISPISQYIRDIPKILYLQEPRRILYEAVNRFPWAALNRIQNIRQIPAYVIRMIEDRIKIHFYRIIARDDYLHAHNYNLILANSLYSRESILRAYGVNAKVCYLGIDSDIFYKEDIEKDNTIISTGVFDETKNPLFILKSVAQLATPRPKIVWVANRVNQEYYKKIIEYIISNNIEFELKQNISDAELRSTLNRSKLFVYAPKLEPFGLAPLEANACGLPVIAVAEGGVRETIANNINGYLIEHDTEHMATAINKLLCDEIARNMLSTSSIIYVKKNWSLVKSIDALEYRINELLFNRVLKKS